MALVLIIMAAMCLTVSTGAQIRPPSGQEILRRVDENITAGNKVMTARMIIHLRRASRTVEFKSYVQGTEKAFTEYLAPPRERGTKMLKLGNQLWMYSPWTERTILISGHMLRQSVMGSDLSYEDMMEDPKLLNSYTAEVVGEETIKLGEGLKAEKTGEKRDPADAGAGSEETKGGATAGQTRVQGGVVREGSEVRCWVLELQARQEDVAYPRRRLWVDRERFITVREELYARGGTLLKKVEVLSLRKFGSRWVPDRAIFKDMLKAGEGTEFVIDSIEFDARIPDYIFTRAALK
ncbi:MAG: hypothetical protein OP8BY_0006 [Candidatus Saccharicenans subterraneus]|uniref:Uncharacterized protein TP-0789 domain-containing protein n=1 Tax=Candidatus Saccharicenans subterraneus TaxID=2508984 RepID=A0A3E2BLN6_9BACT|nr:MAG: hypothetical protein OP8BY_0006 [Candidatus Saccharicenans subterraneum]